MSDARRILDMAETMDKYCTKCRASPINAAARKGYHYAPFYVSAADAQRLRSLIFKIELLNGTDTVILHSSADSGFPHTRPKAVICIPDSFVTSSTDEQLSEMLRHESMHIHQRKYPDLWKTKCLGEGWSPVKTEDIPKRFRDQCRINPDTCYDTPFWAWDYNHAPLPMFRDTENVRLADVRIEWLDLRTGALFHEPPKSFTEKYGSPSQPEHPYEIYAVNFANEGISSHAALHRRLTTPD